jgi:hypothetical protein
MTVFDKDAYQASSPDCRALLLRIQVTNPEVVYYALHCSTYQADAAARM